MMWTGTERYEDLNVATQLTQVVGHKRLSRCGNAIVMDALISRKGGACVIVREFFIRRDISIM
jgi:hypothetical protein